MKSILIFSVMFLFSVYSYAEQINLNDTARTNGKDRDSIMGCSTNSDCIEDGECVPQQTGESICVVCKDTTDRRRMRIITTSSCKPVLTDQIVGMGSYNSDDMISSTGQNNTLVTSTTNANTLSCAEIATDKIWETYQNDISEEQLTIIATCSTAAKINREKGGKACSGGAGAKYMPLANNVLQAVGSNLVLQQTNSLDNLGKNCNLITTKKQMVIANLEGGRVAFNKAGKKVGAQLKQYIKELDLTGINECRNEYDHTLEATDIATEKKGITKQIAEKINEKINKQASDDNRPFYNEALTFKQDPTNIESRLSEEQQELATLHSQVSICQTAAGIGSALYKKNKNTIAPYAPAASQLAELNNFASTPVGPSSYNSLDNSEELDIGPLPSGTKPTMTDDSAANKGVASGGTASTGPHFLGSSGSSAAAPAGGNAANEKPVGPNSILTGFERQYGSLSMRGRASSSKNNSGNQKSGQAKNRRGKPFNLNAFLPGQKNDPQRRLAGIAGAGANIFTIVKNKFHFICTNKRLLDCK